MFKSSGNEAEEGQQKKLDEMDLDAILSNAEAHETEVDPTGASSGGEGFLNSLLRVPQEGPSEEEPSAKASPTPHYKAGSSLKKSKGSSSSSRPVPDYTDDESDRSNYSSMDEGQCKELMRPCKKQLKTLKEGTDHLEREEKVAVLKDCLSAIGGHIDFVVNQDKFKHASVEKKKLWARHLWCFSSFFWPKKVKPSKLKGIFDKLVGTGSEAGTATASKRKDDEERDDKASNAKKPKVEAQ
ncbi:hypothetical protein L7F22_032870 [Adiantum nelumboides]|nr:hypothetical protein [Adiantum nelumboides]